ENRQRPKAEATSAAGTRQEKRRHISRRVRIREKRGKTVRVSSPLCRPSAKGGERESSCFGHRNRRASGEHVEFPTIFGRTAREGKPAQGILGDEGVLWRSLAKEQAAEIVTYRTGAERTMMVVCLSATLT